MARHIELLLLKNIEHLGIVDVVRVSAAPRATCSRTVAEVPTTSASRCWKRTGQGPASGLARSAREELLERMVEVTLATTRSTTTRSPLLQTQQDICDA